jgi:hypothetical protein
MFLLSQKGPKLGQNKCQQRYILYELTVQYLARYSPSGVCGDTVITAWDQVDARCHTRGKKNINGQEKQVQKIMQGVYSVTELKKKKKKEG